ncbi:5,10-methylenetetrahydrofolate reductase [Chthoniobacter flavus Ellin428]|uniref:Methylenetetrahydrofolate reductase n=1 Tax=Chthoniobacter flavus Ellin428 TaxID=497964 RepID=B4D0K5_9BACT|nr:methylenetetrahydrofolate reductase [NAD(P)H] [Chthoniobacter flavus]EDY19867.1 5,10-methylenetetrahydrofolate reductase [Chthoniobacter flavus Ellin428]TCO91862.1 5,10-methylenetetrahydrofolate reductase (NAD(P)) [Chthoniobacter flavus]
MQFIRDIYAEARLAGRPVLSLEFFPTKTEEGERNLLEKTLPDLMSIKPAFCSVTYGAGGGTRDKTLGIVDRIQRHHNLPAMMHLTCVNSTREELGHVLDEAKGRGIQNILALRGDPPSGGDFVKTEGGFEFSRELVSFIRERSGFSIGTAGFPEGHIAQHAGKLVDWQYLADKIAAGADFVVTQLFFDNADYYEFYDHLVGKLGVTVPIVPGIMPILTAGQTRRFVSLCGAKLPAQFLRRLDELDGDDEAVAAYGIEYATEQCASLLEFGVPGLHFYTLNKARSTVQIVRNLGLLNA